MGDYERFLDGKSRVGTAVGFDPVWVPDFLFPFQRTLVEWSVRKGRAAVLAACGLGKTPVQLTWAENVVRHTNRPVLVLTPLAVAPQTVREGEKFGVDCVRSLDGRFPAGARVVVANYDRLHHFDRSDFAGVVCDESAVIKNFAGKRSAEVTEFLRTVPYRLLCTATPAPNDYEELGSSSESLGELGYQDMLNKFFKKQEGNSAIGWGRLSYRLMPHAERSFWRWVCSWGRAVRKPSDLGFDDGDFILPGLETTEHTVTARTRRPGFLFDLPAGNIREQREERRRTMRERCERVAALVADTKDFAIAWCHLNPEGDLLEKLIPGSVQVAGSDPDEAKEEKLLAFQAGQVRVLVSKPIISGYGLNFQHCRHQTFFPSHSFEQYHQAVCRSLRYGQKRVVRVDMVSSEGEYGVLQNLTRKAAAAEAMFDELVSLMHDELTFRRDDRFPVPVRVPAWLRSES